VNVHELERFVRDRLDHVEACYASSLEKQPTLEGRLEIRFAIHPDGSITNVVSSSDTLGGPELAGCVVRVVAAWKSPFRPTEQVSVVYRFHLRAAP
jgi:hypothetical protein